MMGYSGCSFFLKDYIGLLSSGYSGYYGYGG